MKPVSSINFDVMASAPVSTACAAARVTIATISPRMPSESAKILAASAGRANPDGLRNGSTASSVLRRRRYSSFSVQTGSGIGSKRLTSWSSLRIARSARADVERACWS